VKTIFHFLFWRTSIECRDIEDMLLLISCLRPRIFKLKAKLKTGGAAEEQQSTSDFQQDARFEKSRFKQRHSPYAVSLVRATLDHQDQSMFVRCYDGSGSSRNGPVKTKACNSWLRRPANDNGHLLNFRFGSYQHLICTFAVGTLGLNSEPFACEANVMPLQHVRMLQSSRRYFS